MFWIYWFIAIVICSVIESAINNICGIKTKIFSKVYVAYLVQRVLQVLIAYYLFSAIKGEWILSPTQMPLMDNLFLAIQKVETPIGVDISANKYHIGPYQISYAYWYDSNVPGEWNDCNDSDYSQQVMIAYWKRYVPNALKNKDFEVLSRTHYGGPNGVKKKSTLVYWKLVQKELNYE